MLVTGMKETLGKLAVNQTSTGFPNQPTNGYAGYLNV